MLIDVIRDINKASKDYLMRFDDVLNDSSEAEYWRRSALTELRKAIVRFNEIEVRRILKQSKRKNKARKN